jgi:hypothetical protein
VTEGSALSRITSNLFNHARQSLEQIFRRPGRTDGIVPKNPAVKEYGGKAFRGGLVGQIHANSRGLLAKYIERNRSSELVNAMKQLYGGRGAFCRGMWGQKFSTFAFVGIGVATGAQWNAVDGKYNFQDQLPDILNFFGKDAVHKPEKKAVQVAELDTLSNHWDVELEAPLNLSEHEFNSEVPSFIQLDHLSFDDYDVSVLESTEVMQCSPVIHESEVSQYQIFNADMVGSSLLEQLNRSLLRVDQQRAELDSLRTSVAQLNALLYDIVGPLADQEHDVEIVESSIRELEILDVESGDLGDRLIRTLSVIDQQQLQSSLLKRLVLAHNQQLQELCEAMSRPVIVRSAFSKKDACCGPGTVLHTNKCKD